MAEKPRKQVSTPEISGPQESSSLDPLSKWVGKVVCLSLCGGVLEGTLLAVSKFTITVKGFLGKSNPYEGYTDEVREFLVYKSSINFVHLKEVSS